jgi:Holliday junction resolvasome RuvABC endonuclease subunit
MISLGLDPSLTAFGWCLFDSNAKGRKRRIASGHEETLSTSVPVTRYIHLRSKVKSLLNTFEPEVVGIESPAFEAGTFVSIHHSLMIYSLEAIFEYRKDCVLFDPATLKSLARGSKSNIKGPMTKLDMQRFVSNDTMDPELIDNNEADAYCIAYFASRFTRLFNGDITPQDLSEPESRIFLEKTKKVKTLKGVKTKRTAHIFRENNRFYRFSQVPAGRIDLPKKSDIDPTLIQYLEQEKE